MWWDDPKTVESLHLTDEQRKKIAAIVEQSQKKRRELNAQLVPLRHVVPDLLSQPELDEQKVQSTLKTQNDLRWARVQEMASMRIQVRKVLSAEQFKKLQALHPLVMRKRWVARQLPGEGEKKSPAETKAEPEQEEDEEDMP